MLQSVFGISVYSAAVAHTTEADTTGSSIVMTVVWRKPNGAGMAFMPTDPTGGCPIVAGLLPLSWSLPRLAFHGKPQT